MAHNHRITRAAQHIATLFGWNRTIAQTFAGVVTFGLGYWGWTIKDPPTDYTTVLNDVFRTLQLISLQFPSEFSLQVPWQLQIARLAVPIVAALATFDIFIGTITRPFRLAALSRSRSHVVLVSPDQVSRSGLEEHRRWMSERIIRG